MITAFLFTPIAQECSSPSVPRFDGDGGFRRIPPPAGIDLHYALFLPDHFNRLTRKLGDGRGAGPTDEDGNGRAPW